jgi:hypothetical protein
MSVRMAICVSLVSLAAAAAAQAGTLCELESTQQYRDCVRIVDSLRPDKGGQSRVFAPDGSEFTAGQALWMQAQMRKVARLCVSANPSDQAEAVRLLSEVTDLLKSHHRNS